MHLKRYMDHEGAETMLKDLRTRDATIFWPCWLVSLGDIGIAVKTQAIHGP